MRIHYQDNEFTQLIRIHDTRKISTVNVSENDFEMLLEQAKEWALTGTAIQVGDGWFAIEGMFSIHLDSCEPDLSEQYDNVVTGY